MTTYRKAPKGFTLVEILIVVIILGILAAVVIPQFTNASEDARQSSTASQLQTIRSAVELYKLQHRDAYPTDDGLVTGAWVWGKLIGKTTEAGAVDAAGPFGPYLQAEPRNGLTNSSTVDDEPGTTVGWVLQADGRIMGVTKAGGLMNN